MTEETALIVALTARLAEQQALLERTMAQAELLVVIVDAKDAQLERALAAGERLAALLQAQGEL